PTHLLDLVVVGGGIATGHPHKEELHPLVMALAPEDEPVLNLAGLAYDLRLEPGLLEHLTPCRVGQALALLGQSFREDPARLALGRPHPNEGDPAVVGDRDPAGREFVDGA